MRDFTFYAPTRVVFGENAELQAGRLIRDLGARRVLLVYGGGSAVRSGLLDRLQACLLEAGLPVIPFGGAQPNPTLAHAEAGAALAREAEADFVLAVGGGSAIDTGKAIAHGAKQPDVALWKLWSGAAPVKEALPVGAVLTIPAAGSETSDSAVLTNETVGQKRGLSSERNRPVFALMNPRLALTLPPYQMACGVTDILMHTLDRYFNPVTDNLLTDAIAESLLRVVLQAGRKLLQAPDYHAMSELMWCGSLSHNGLTGLGGEKDFAPHQLGHPLSARFGVAHGASLAAVWPSWARFVWRQNAARFAQYARRVWDINTDDDEAAAQEGIDATERYFRSLGMPVRLDQLGIPAQEPAVLADLADLCSYGKSRTIGSFQVLTYADVLAIYQLASH